jgi:CRISPR-associated protein Cas5h
MEILTFKIKGKLAHFRKYYANNTAFSFTIPPRTTLMGIVAAAMGHPKDSYYEDFSSENIKFGIRVLSPLKKSFHRLNFLSIKSIGDMSKKWSSDFRGEDGRIQTPFEVISAWNLGKEDVEYQIFVSYHESGFDVFQKIKSHFLNKSPIYNITLGTANFSASLSDIQIIQSTSIKQEKTNDFVLMNSAIPTYMVQELEFDKEEFDNYNFIEEDMMPGDFVSNKSREVKKMNQLLFSITPNPLRIKISREYFQIQTKDEVLNIQFIDS